MSQQPDCCRAPAKVSSKKTGAEWNSGMRRLGAAGYSPYLSTIGAETCLQSRSAIILAGRVGRVPVLFQVDRYEAPASSGICDLVCASDD